MEKKEARRLIRQATEGMTTQTRVEKSEAVRNRVRDLPEVHAARAVMGFLPMADELDTRPILADLIADGKRVYVPRTFTREKRMIPVRLTDLSLLRQGGYGILEPDTDETCDPADLDLIIVPARAFDRRGNRLGRGAGFYDRFLAAEAPHAVRLGIGFACQLLPHLPHDHHDLPVQILITETHTLRFDLSC